MKSTTETRKSNRRIVLLDDERATRRQVKHALAREDFEIVCLSPTEDWLNRLAKIQPALIVSEIFCGEWSIFEVIQQLNQKKEFASIPLLVLSSLYFEAIEFERILDPHEKRNLRRISLFLHKPYDLPLLGPHIKQILQEKNPKRIRKCVPNVSPTVLIVEDDEIQRSILKELLQGKQYRLLEALNGRMAVELFQEHSPALVLLDIMLPEIDGIRVLQRIKSWNGSCHVIMMTGHSDERRAIQCLKAGADDYVMKPFDTTQFVKTVDRLLALSQSEAARRRLEHRLTETSLNLFRAMVSAQKAKRHLLATQRRLIKAEKVAAITRTVVSLHHEIKNPLGAISGNLQLWQRTPRASFPIDKDIKNMIQAIRRIQKVLDKLSNLTHPVETTYVGTIQMIDLKKSRFRPQKISSQRS